MMGFKKWCDKCKEEKGLHNDCPASPTKSEECNICKTVHTKKLINEKKFMKLAKKIQKQDQPQKEKCQCNCHPYVMSAEYYSCSHCQKDK